MCYLEMVVTLHAAHLNQPTYLEGTGFLEELTLEEELKSCDRVEVGVL